jgi:hypothetical protein
MGFWDLLPLGVAAVVVYLTTTLLARVVLRRVRGRKAADAAAAAADRRQGERRQPQDRRQAERRSHAVEAAPRAKTGARSEPPRRPALPTAPIAPEAPAQAAAKPTKERIESLDFTVAEAAALVEASGEDLPVVPSAVNRSEAEDVGLTLVLDTAELMRSIAGKAPPPPAAPAPAEAAPVDWAAALSGIRPLAGETAKPAFFEAPRVDAPTLDLTQPVPVAPPRGALPEPPDLVPAAALSTSQAMRFADEKPVIEGPTIDLYVDAEPELRVVATSEVFRRFAVAHDDIQTARSAFEELMTLRRSIADPVHRALVFGACAAYARPFLGKPGQAPTLDVEWATFADREHAEAHIELLLLRSRLLDGTDPEDEEIVVVAGGEGEDEVAEGAFAIRSTVFRRDRLPAYAKLCTTLEARLHERLATLAEPEELPA